MIQSTVVIDLTTIRHLMSDAHEGIDEMPTVRIYFLLCWCVGVCVGGGERVGGGVCVFGCLICAEDTVKWRVQVERHISEMIRHMSQGCAQQEQKSHNHQNGRLNIRRLAVVFNTTGHHT